MSVLGIADCSLKGKKKKAAKQQVTGSFVLPVTLIPPQFCQPHYSPRNIFQGIELIFGTPPYKRGNNIQEWLLIQVISIQHTKGKYFNCQKGSMKGSCTFFQL